MDTLEEQKAAKLRQRLWGAAVLIALAVIFLPLLLDGAGSESQYRRVERLREEPPRVIREDGQQEVASIPEVAPIKTALNVKPILEPTVNAVQEQTTIPKAPDTPQSVDVNISTLSAWVVQAGSFGDEQNALAVRDRLRRAGHPSFITATDDRALFRVRVGPMTNQTQAASTRDDVVRLLGREALVTPYP
ncbi:MAG: SPOR domain-containing protein [Granulosicoccaceae bacterium]